MLHLENLTCRFGEKHAVSGVDLAIAPGSFVGVIGRSGAGKSTLLRMINRLQVPTAGHVSFGERNITSLKGAALRAWRADCAMVFQQFNLVGRLDVFTNVMMGRLNRTGTLRSLLGLWRNEDRARVFEALERFEIANLAAQRAESLSGGQQQRVAIARAFVQQPSVILADEPTASLDPRNAIVVMDALKHINQDFGISVICNLHSLDLAKAYCQRLIGMSEGQVVFDGTPGQLTDAQTQRLYGMEAGSVHGPKAALSPELKPAPVWAAAVANAA